jgi:radical SAM superfamily enzyme YgiQ (UPF0313 family)
MNVLLVYPLFTDSYWSFRHALWLENRRSAFPPLGLLTVAAMLPRTWHRRLVDMNIQSLRNADLAWADVVFVSGMTIQAPSMEQVIRRCKEMGKRVVVGGPYVSSTPELVPDADHVFVGEVEPTLSEFVRDLEAGNPRRVYETVERPDLTTSPVPEFELLAMDQYLAMPIQYSRGCPFRCEFCDIIELYGRVPRTKTIEQVLAELDALKRTGRCSTVFLVDDNFIGNKRNVRAMLPYLAEWSERNGWPFSFITEASINLADDDELLGLMQRAGFHRVFIGIETPDEESLKEAQKVQNTRRDLLEGIRKIQSYGMEVMAGFIVGFDSDREDIFDRQIDFIRASAIPLAMVGLLTALPNTQLSRRLEREGRLLAASTGNNTDGTLNFIPRMDRDLLVHGYHRILRTIYSPSEFYQRAYESLERVGPGTPEQIGDRNLFKRLTTLGRMLFQLGVRDPQRGEFWRFLGRVLRARPSKMPQALVLAAMGYHFRKLTEATVPAEPETIIPPPEESHKRLAEPAIT